MNGWINKLMNVNKQKKSLKIRMNKSMNILQSNEWTNKNGWINKLMNEQKSLNIGMKESVNKLINTNTEIDLRTERIQLMNEQMNLNK